MKGSREESFTKSSGKVVVANIAVVLRYLNVWTRRIKMIWKANELMWWPILK